MAGGRVGWFERAAPLAAAALSAAYALFHLRGGPRIVDSTAYFLQARALADGFFAWPIAPDGTPEHALHGRFLVPTDADGVPALSGIFPPGWPALLAVGMRLGVPLAIGPALAAALVVATMDLARELASGARDADAARARAVARVAGALSIVSAALRYHTADTMSHGLAALLLCVALSASLRIARRWPGGRGLRAPALALGGAGGWLVATRPVTALALAATLALGAGVALIGRARPRPRSVLAVFGLAALAALPGIALHAAHQRAATGSIFGSAQLAYYALSDGPPGCFRYGFGAGIGCLGEHGDVVSRLHPFGFTLPEALATTARRVGMHAWDVLNEGSLLSLVLLGLLGALRRRATLLLGAAVLVHILAYLPFYYDGNYPGGGARMLADVLPVEHVLGAWALALFARTPRGLGALGGVVVVAAVLGFARDRHQAHDALRTREGGRPMLEPERLRAPALAGALVFVSTDHGFNLGHLPRAGLRGEPRVVRHRGDALDRLAWEAHGRPPAFRYLYGFDWSTPTRPAEIRIEPLSFDPAPTATLDELRVEAESLWPPAGQSDAWAWPRPAARCASERWALALVPAARGGSAEPATGTVILRIPAALLAGRSLAPRLVLAGNADPVTLSLSIERGAGPIAIWQWDPANGDAADIGSRCVALAPAGGLGVAAGAVHLEVRFGRGAALDALGFVRSVAGVPIPSKNH
jgi:hypothetical protein